MPLEVTVRSMQRTRDRALHRQLADLIRDHITSGALAPDEALPSENDIAAMADLSRTTVRNALDILAGEGLIVRRTGSATRIAVPPRVRHLATSRYADELALLHSLDRGEMHPLTSAFTAEHDTAWEDYHVEATYREEHAGEDAVSLGIEPDAYVLRRLLVKLVGRTPVQLQTSVIPFALVAGTPVAEPINQPWPGGTLAELYSVGQIVTHVVEEARARVPSEAERQALELPAEGAGVLEIRRIFSTRQRPVEASTVITPAAGTVLRYETAL